MEEEVHSYSDSSSHPWKEHARVPCFHPLCQCNNELQSSDFDDIHDDNQDNQHLIQQKHHHHKQQHQKLPKHRQLQEHQRRCHRHQHNILHPASRHLYNEKLHHSHYIHHYHHHHHNELHSSSSTSSWASFEVGSLHRLLTLFVFLLSWASVCAAPRRPDFNTISRYNNLDAEHANSFPFNTNPPHPMAAISPDEALLQPPVKSLQAKSELATSSSSAPSSSASSSSSLRMTTSSKTGSEPDTPVGINSAPTLDSIKALGNFPVYMSQRVAFSVERPQTPPWPGDMTFEPSMEREESEQSDTSADWNGTSIHSRRRRSATLSAYDEVCESTSRWVSKHWGTDMYGQNVTILSEIMNAGNQRVTQWFYETNCARQHGVQTCLGIDDVRYESLCLSKPAWVYAMIRTSAGEEGWTWIAINSSCNCAIKHRSILERIGRDRFR